MTLEKPCIFNRDSKCVFKGGLCDLDCDKANDEGDPRSYEDPDILDKRLGRGSRRLTFTRVFHWLLSTVY